MKKPEETLASFYLERIHMKKLCCSLLLITLLQACGFHLKGQYYLPANLQTLHLSSVKAHSPVLKELKAKLTHNNVNLVEKSSDEVTELRVLPEQFQRRTLSLFPNGQLAEYELLYRVSAEVAQPQSEIQRFDIELSREFQDDPNNALAKQRERELILSELRALAADRILAQLNTIH